jgi:hypothetical protein
MMAFRDVSPLARAGQVSWGVRQRETAILTIDSAGMTTESQGQLMNRKLLTLITVGTLLSLGHIADHAIRDDLRWPSPALISRPRGIVHRETWAHHAREFHRGQAGCLRRDVHQAPAQHAGHAAGPPQVARPGRGPRPRCALAGSRGVANVLVSYQLRPGLRRNGFRRGNGGHLGTRCGPVRWAACDCHHRGTYVGGPECPIGKSS